LCLDPLWLLEEAEEAEKEVDTYELAVLDTDMES
jgi:hypothetical protein